MCGSSDTIAGIATAPGLSGVAIIRVSGDRAEEILYECFTPGRSRRKVRDIPERLMRYGYVRDEAGEAVDEAMAVLFRAPGSYTAEDVAELHVHGGRAAVHQVMRRVLGLGARIAQPGEFTRRAFENGRIDLSQAEGVMDAVAAQGELAQKAAVRQISGQLSRAVAAMQQDMTLLLAKIGATVDYPEEDLEDEARTQCRQALQKHESELSRLLDGANTARRVREGVRVALWGRPNVGKSSLLNALLGDERAIVTPIAGTTRDTLEETLIVEGLVLRLIDTAGFREAGDDIEAIGVRRARKALEEADMALLVLDASQTLDERDIRQAGELPGKPLLVAVNKSDLPAKISLEQVQEAFPGAVVMPISALSGDGIEALMKQMVKTALGTDAAGASEHLLGNPRHIEALKEAQSAMLSGIEAAKEAMPPDILAIDIRAAWRALGRITGQTCDEDVIDAIFEHFCVGK